MKQKHTPKQRTCFGIFFAGSRGGLARSRIITQLRERPSNKNQISQDLDFDYKGIEHHLRVLEENNLVTKIGGNYGATYFVSSLFEESQEVFDEIVTKLKKVGGDEWSR